MNKKSILTIILMVVAAFNATAQDNLEEKLIRMDADKTETRNSSERLAFFHKELVRLLVPEKAEFGVERVPSNGRESALTYDPETRALVYRVAEGNIWKATKEDYKAPTVKVFTLPIDQDKAIEWQMIIRNVFIIPSVSKEDNQLDGIRWEFFSDGKRAYTKNHNGAIAKFTDALILAVRNGDKATAETLIETEFKKFGTKFKLD